MNAIQLPGIQSQPVTDIAFSPEGKYLASSGMDGTILVYGGKDWNELVIALKTPSNGILSLAFGPGSELAGGEQEGGIYFWKDPFKGDAQTFKGHSRPVISVLFSLSSGLYSGSADGEVFFWDVSQDSPEKLACKQAGRDPTVEELQSLGMDMDNIAKYQFTCKAILAAP